MYRFACSTKQKLCLFNMHVLQCPHDVDMHLLFCFDRYLHITCSLGNIELWFCSSILTAVCAVPSKSCTFSTCYHACIFPHDVDVHLLFCFDLDLHITCSHGFSSSIIMYMLHLELLHGCRTSVLRQELVLYGVYR